MKAWMVVNSFLRSAKFEEIYGMLTRAARGMGIDLVLRGNAELAVALPGALSEPRPDFVLFWDKDTALARVLETCGLSLFNSADAVEATDDKRRTQSLLARAGVRMPEAIASPLTFDPKGYPDLSFLDRAEALIGYPMVLKEAFGSFGMQVHLADSRAEAEALIRSFGARPFLMQRFVAAARGRDVRANVVGDQVICCMERRSRNGDFRSNATLGGAVAACDPPEEAKELAVRAARALGLAFAGVDLLFEADGTPTVCEVNSNPHFASTYDATGIDLAPCILREICERVTK